jgi:hypothetical protein
MITPLSPCVLLNFFIFTSLLSICKGAHVLFFAVGSKSQLLAASHMASLLADAGHQVTIVNPESDNPDIPKSPKYRTMLYHSRISRDTLLQLSKEFVNWTPKNILLGRVNSLLLLDIFSEHCRGFLFNQEFQDKILALQPDVALVAGLMPCYIPFLVKHSIPFLDFCGEADIPLCRFPHRIPGTPSYMHDGSVFEGDLTFS